MKKNDFFASTVDESWIDSTITAFNNLNYDITDKQTTKWQKNAVKKQSKKSRQNSSSKIDSDRFIPIRDEHKFDQQQKYINREETKQQHDNDRNEESIINHKPEQEDAHKILAFKTKAPEASDGYISNLRVLYTVGSSNNKKNKLNNHNNHRHISQTAERILDAPDLMDDFYLNLLDWGCKNIIAIGLGSCLYLWNAENGEINLLYDYGEDIYICSVSYNHDAQYIAVGTSNNIVTLFDSTTSKILRKLYGHSSRVSSVSWNHSILSTGSADSTIRNNDVRQKNYLISIFGESEEYNDHEQEICGLKWNNNVNGKYLASGSNDNKSCIWCLENPSQPIHQFTESLSAVKALAWCPWNNNLLATGGGSGDRKIRIYDISSNGNLCNYVDTESQVCSLIWNPFEKEILSSHGFSKNQLSVWKYPSLKKTHDLTGHTSRILHTSLSPNGEMVVSAAADETLRFWKVFENTKKLKQEDHHYDNNHHLNLNQNHKNKTSINGLNLRIR